ncbi:Uncharacterised protein [uncultured archaeon]|nr:Uncharacterised protein [uncultured archaeon]
MNCSQCGQHTDEVWVVLWAKDMGKLCRSCFDEVSACPPKTKERVPEAEKQAKRVKALEAARVASVAARKQRAADRAAQKAETEARKRAENPERYDAQLAQRRESIKKAQTALLAKRS